MTLYYEILTDGTIGQSTQYPKVAKQLNLTHKTSSDIVYGYDGKRYIKGSEPTKPEPSYIEKRLAEYPSLSDQLDMIYWDKINGTNLWQEKISQIKSKYPKE